MSESFPFTTGETLGAQELDTAIGLVPWTGGVNRTNSARLNDIVNINDFGLARDGKTDDSAKVLAAVVAASTTDRKLYIPAGGPILMAGAAQVTLNNIFLSGDSFQDRGAGAGVAYDQSVSGQVGSVFWITDTTKPAFLLGGNSVRIEGLNFYYPNQVSQSTTASASVSSGNTITVANGAAAQVGAIVVNDSRGTGIPARTTVVAVSGNSVTLSNGVVSATVDGTVVPGVTAGDTIAFGFPIVYPPLFSPANTSQGMQAFHMANCTVINPYDFMDYSQGTTFGSASFYGCQIWAVRDCFRMSNLPEVVQMANCLFSLGAANIGVGDALAQWGGNNGAWWNQFGNGTSTTASAWNGGAQVVNSWIFGFNKTVWVQGGEGTAGALSLMFFSQVGLDQTQTVFQADEFSSVVQVYFDGCYLYNWDLEDILGRSQDAPNGSFYFNNCSTVMFGVFRMHGASFGTTFNFQNLPIYAHVQIKDCDLGISTAEGATGYNFINIGGLSPLAFVEVDGNFLESYGSTFVAISSSDTNTILNVARNRFWNFASCFHSGVNGVPAKLLGNYSIGTTVSDYSGADNYSLIDLGNFWSKPNFGYCPLSLGVSPGATEGLQITGNSSGYGPGLMPVSSLPNVPDMNFTVMTTGEGTFYVLPNAAGQPKVGLQVVPQAASSLLIPCSSPSSFLTTALAPASAGATVILVQSDAGIAGSLFAADNTTTGAIPAQSAVTGITSIAVTTTAAAAAAAGATQITVASAAGVYVNMPIADSSATGAIATGTLVTGITTPNNTVVLTLNAPTAGAINVGDSLVVGTGCASVSLSGALVAAISAGDVIAFSAPTPVVTTATAAAAAGATSIQVASTTDLFVGQSFVNVSHAGTVPPGITIASISGSTVGLAGGAVAAPGISAGDLLVFGPNIALAIGYASTPLGFFGATPVFRPAVGGAVGTTASLKGLLEALNSVGLLADNTTIGFNLNVAAAGTTQATATPLTDFLSVITTAAAGEGVSLDTEIGTQKVVNQTAVAVPLYPPDGEEISGLGVNVPFSLLPGQMVIAENPNSTIWYLAATPVGALAVSSGGTGQAALAAHGILVGEGTGAVNALVPTAAGQLPISQGTTADLAWAAMSGDATINAGGTITVASAADGFVVKSGNLGVGNTSPSAGVDIAVPAAAIDGGGPWDGHWLRLGATTSTGAGIGVGFDLTTNTGYIACLTPGTAWEPFILEANQITLTDQGGGTTFVTRGSFAWNYSTTPWMALNSTGLGIGTTSPTALLDVEGVICAGGSGTITSAPPSVSTNGGWKFGLYGNQHWFGVSPYTLNVLTAAWISFFGGATYPAGNASTSAPDTNAAWSFNAQTTHVVAAGGAAPTITSNAGTPTIVGTITDAAGSIIPGPDSTETFVLFGSPYGDAPKVLLTGIGGNVYLASAPTTTGFTVSSDNLPFNFFVIG